MAIEDDLLGWVLAVAGPELPKLVASEMAGKPKLTAPPAAPNGQFTDDYLNSFKSALIKILTIHLSRSNGRPIAADLNLIDRVTVPITTLGAAVNTSLRQVIDVEAGPWPVGADLQRESVLAYKLLTTYARMQPALLEDVVRAARAARDERIQASSTPAAAPAALLKEVPLEGDVLARELSGPARAFGIRLLSGFLGSSDVPGYRRLYRNLEFNEYLDIPDAAIVKTLDLRTMANPIGGSLVWVGVGIKLIHGSVGYTRPELEGRFLAGDSGGGWEVAGEWTGPRGEWTGPRGEWTGPRGEWTGPRGEWTGPRG
jgi:hypothetical protein